MVRGSEENSVTVVGLNARDFARKKCRRCGFGALSTQRQPSVTKVTFSHTSSSSTICTPVLDLVDWNGDIFSNHNYSRDFELSRK